MDLYAVYVNLRCVGFFQRSANKERTHALPIEFLLTRLFGSMGYSGYKEYLADLPGHDPSEKFDVDWDGNYLCWFGEGPLDDFGLNHGLRISFEEIDLESIVESSHVSYRSVLCHWIDGAVREDGWCMFLMQPTMQNVIDGWDYTEYPTHDDMWFCSDWKDPDDSIDKETLTEMDHSIANLKKGIVSSEIDLSDFEEE